MSKRDLGMEILEGIRKIKAHKAGNRPQGAALKPKPAAPASVDAYLAACPPPARAALEQIRQAVRQAAPRVEEKFSYKMLGFFVDGHAVLYAGAYKKHIGLYPAPPAEGPFAAAVARYGAHRSTLQLPLDEPMPLGLIRRLVRARVRENRERDKAQAKQ